MNIGWTIAGLETPVIHVSNIYIRKSLQRCKKPSVLKFFEFMSLKKKKEVVKIAQFCKIINNKFTEVDF